MKSIRYEKDGKIIGILVEPNEGEFLSINNYETLLKCIKNICLFKSDEEEKLVNTFKVNEKGFYVEGSEDNIMLDTIVLKLNQIITENVIVIQDMGIGPAIRHRVFYFNATINGQIEIKYTELGHLNSIENALEYISTFDRVEV